MLTIRKDLIKQIARIAFLTVIVSFYLFPIGFRGLPESLNTKQILGVIGIGLFALRSIRDRGLSMSKYVVNALLLACVFSIWCYFSCVANNTSDYSYATYFMSFAVWLGGAYATCEIAKGVHGKVDLNLITAYMAAACVMQCAFVLMVDNIPAFQGFVDTWFIQDRVPKRVGRLYGIGCSLDSGGVRFCMTLILIAHQLARNTSLTENKMATRLYITAFLIITVVGNMVARTTIVGVGLSGIYLIAVYGYSRKGILSKRQVMVLSFFLMIIGIVTGLTIYLYNTDPGMRRWIRFAFEAFFNYAETGEFSTASTDKLNNEMWVWPWDDMGWAIGYGMFNSSAWGHFMTDIGYCRFTLYCGLIGLSLFSIYFIYNASVVWRKFNEAGWLAFLLMCLTFIIWIKVATDIFQLYALLLCIPPELGQSSSDNSE